MYGSLDEIERDFGVRPDNLHRPDIDELVRPNPDDPTGRSMMRRVPEVLDCWFESGSMPFAQVHYPFENADWFEHHHPGDFIVELPVGSSGLGRVRWSTNGRWRSGSPLSLRGSLPKSRSISSKEP